MDEARLDAYCGLYCGACEILAAYRRGKKIGQKPQWEDLPEQIKSNIPRAEIICHGCRTDEVFAGCRDCRVRECARERDVAACFFCRDYPCSLTEELRRLAEGASERMPHVAGIFGGEATAKGSGYDAWAEAQRAGWSCPSCGAPFTWYQEICGVCRMDIKGLKGYL